MRTEGTCKTCGDEYAQGGSDPQLKLDQCMPCEFDEMRERLAAIEDLSDHADHRPCVLRVLGEFYSPAEAYGIAIEQTCFPMSCQVASEQAIALLASRREDADTQVQEDENMHRAGESPAPTTAEGPTDWLVDSIRAAVHGAPTHYRARNVRTGQCIEAGSRHELNCKIAATQEKPTP